jgi:hypothetical protein
MKQTRRGNQREVDLTNLLEADGWVVGSRRHIGGPGDLLAIDQLTVDRILLCEVKSTAGGPWERYGPLDRRALGELGLAIDAIPCLAWWPPRANGSKWFRWHPGVELESPWPAWIGPLPPIISSDSTTSSAPHGRSSNGASPTRHRTTPLASGTASLTTSGSTESPARTRIVESHD